MLSCRSFLEFEGHCCAACHDDPDELTDIYESEVVVNGRKDVLIGEVCCAIDAWLANQPSRTEVVWTAYSQEIVRKAYFLGTRGL